MPTVSHQSQVSAVAADYFGIPGNPAPADHPIITQVFRPGRGWTRHPLPQQAGIRFRDPAAAREGATGVALSFQGRASPTSGPTIATLLRCGCRIIRTLGSHSPTW